LAVCHNIPADRYQFLEYRATGTRMMREITHNNNHYPLKVIQGHRFWYQSKAHMRLPISD